MRRRLEVRSVLWIVGSLGCLHSRVKKLGFDKILSVGRRALVTRVNESWCLRVELRGMGVRRIYQDALAGLELRL